jgi:hypothetical protein
MISTWEMKIVKAQTRSTSKGRAVLYKARYRSRLEERIADQLDDAGIKFQYENRKVKYTVPARNATYTPDFDLGTFLVEAKGYFRSASDRQKLVLVKKDNPELDIRLVFQKASNPIYKGSPTTYSKWAEDHGFKWADNGVIPHEWLEEINEPEASAVEAPEA